MTELYFVVHRSAGEDYPALYHDYLPKITSSADGAGSQVRRFGLGNPIVYVLRLDALEGGVERWQAMSLGDHWRTYQKLKSAGKLQRQA